MTAKCCCQRSMKKTCKDPKCPDLDDVYKHVHCKLCGDTLYLSSKYRLAVLTAGSPT